MMTSTNPAAAEVPALDAALAEGMEWLDATLLADGMYAFAAEDGGWYRADAADIRALGARILAGTDDDRTVQAEAVRDTDHDALDRIVTALGDVTAVDYRCQCGEAMGQRCEWTGDRRDLVRVMWVPESDRGSAEASGSYTRGAYATALQVTQDCADALAAGWDEDGEPLEGGDPFARIVGPAYEDEA